MWFSPNRIQSFFVLFFLLFCILFLFFCHFMPSVFLLSLPVDGWCLYWWWYVGWIFFEVLKTLCLEYVVQKMKAPIEIAISLRDYGKEENGLAVVPSYHTTSQSTDRPIYNNNCIYKYRVFDFRMVFNIFHLLGKCSNFQCIIHDMTASMEVGTF